MSTGQEFPVSSRSPSTILTVFVELFFSEGDDVIALTQP